MRNEDYRIFNIERDSLEFSCVQPSEAVFRTQTVKLAAISFTLFHLYNQIIYFTAMARERILLRSFIMRGCLLKDQKISWDAGS